MGRVYDGKLVAVLAALLAAGVVRAEAPGEAAGIIDTKANAQRVAPNEKFEVTFDVPGQWSNPFDPDVVAVDGIFQTPDGKTLVQPAFYYQDYERSESGGRERLTAVGKPAWKVRFTPVMAGKYRYRLERTAGGKTSRTEEQTLVCAGQPRGHGFLRVSRSNPYYFQFDDGTPFFAVGENLATLNGRGTFAADQWYGRLAGVGGNFARSWWCAGGTDLESQVGRQPGRGLGRYNLDQAWRIDYLIGLAERLGIRLMCCLETQQYLRRDAWWAQFSYNQANGGPVATPADFFVNPQADRYFRNRLRYLVARWSYSPAVCSWQFWNEVSALQRFPRGAGRRLAPTDGPLPAIDRSLPPRDPFELRQYGRLPGSRWAAGDGGRFDEHLFPPRHGPHRGLGHAAMIERYRKPYLLTEYGVGHRAPGSRRTRPA